MQINKVEEYKIENVLTFRGKIKGNEVNSILGSALNKIGEQGFEINGSTITAIHSIENDCGDQIMDIEIVIPINGVMTSNDEFVYRDKFEISNALMFRHIGDPQTMNTEMQEFTQYINDNDFKPVTPFYNVTVRSASSPSETENIIMDIYVGVK